MCFFSRSGYRPLINPPLVPRKATFRYNSYDQFHSGVVLFFVNVRVRVRVSYRDRVRDRVPVRDR